MAKLVDIVERERSELRSAILATRRMLGAPNTLQESALQVNRDRLDQIIERHLQTLTVDVAPVVAALAPSGSAVVDQVVRMAVELEEAYIRHKGRPLPRSAGDADFLASAGLLLRQLERLLDLEQAQLIPLMTDAG